MKECITLLGLFLTVYVKAQVGIGTTSPEASSILDIDSNRSGVLIPRLTNTQMNNIVSPAEGLVVYNKTSDSFWYYNFDSTSWEELGDNLGNHIAEENLQMSGNWISNDGDDEGVYIRNTGNVGINTNTPNAILHVNAVGNNIIFDSPNNFIVNNPGASPLGSSIAMVSNIGNPVLRFDLGNGGGGVRQTWDLRVDDVTSDFVVRDVNSGQDMLEISNVSGRVDVGTNGDGSFIRANAFTVYSDRRLKENITRIQSAYEKLNQISGYTYTYKNVKNIKQEYGVIAQEVETVLPSAVYEDEDGMKSVDYSRIIPLLIEAVKAQQKEINTLRGINKQHQ